MLAFFVFSPSSSSANSRKLRAVCVCVCVASATKQASVGGCHHATSKRALLASCPHVCPLPLTLSCTRMRTQAHVHTTDLRTMTFSPPADDAMVFWFVSIVLSSWEVCVLRGLGVLVLCVKMLKLSTKYESLFGSRWLNCEFGLLFGTTLALALDPSHTNSFAPLLYIFAHTHTCATSSCLEGGDNHASVAVI